ncbi:hypothetical protein [Saccharothrix australiensis]|uniref:Uncharacterized protein n=1 Tax=Saccharothrix australiensis TaxID=2072 RepID=A0A495VZ80_9PSEU|nr:hypothetical protein [Saccharothrix australiensis]RKT54519.1 hypothetical protein C8E97_3162 [Saccharothrix australiensis]
MTMRTNLPALAGVELGAGFRAVVDAVAALVSPPDGRVAVLLDDLPDSSARLDLVRLAVIVALERGAGSVRVLPVTACYWARVGTEWLISRVEPARGFTFVGGAEQPRERTVTLAEGDDGSVRVAVGGAGIDVAVPSEQECLRLLGSGVLGRALRFPVFPSSGPSLVARGDGPDELVLWRCGLPAAAFRLPGPVLAAIHVSDTSVESLIALIGVGGELVVHVEGFQDLHVRRLRVPVDFSVADEAGRDLSPLYLAMDEPWRFGVYFRRAGTWWELHRLGDRTSLERSPAVVHQPGTSPFHTTTDGAGLTLAGPGCSRAARDGTTWRVWGPRLAEASIPVPPGEDVLGLAKLGDRPALVTREGDVVRARTSDGVRTVVESAGPVARHQELPWVAVQRSPRLVEVLDVATGAVLHRVGTAGDEPRSLRPVVELLRAGGRDGLGAVALAGLAREHLGDAFDTVTFLASFRMAFGVPFETMRAATAWRGHHPGPHALSDAEFERLLAPWLDRPRGA